MKNITDLELLSQLKAGESAAFRLIYKLYFTSIATYIKKNSGNSHDAEDIFQEVMVVLLQKIKQPDFILSASLHTYLYAVAKNLWLKRLRNDKTVLADQEQLAAHLADQAVTFKVEVREEKQQEDYLHIWLQKITQHCRQILKAIFFYNEPMAALMEKMGWKNRHTADNQKYKCIQQIKSVSVKERRRV